jgi:catechol 2,3-dioxygenase-like lactoylglutathione lyase family enzyme
VSGGPSGIYETVLYGSDVAALVSFYGQIVGLRAIDPPDEHSAAFRLGDGSLLLIFDPQRSAAPGRFVPSHGTSGDGHVAFRIGDGELDPYTDSLRAAGVEVEREITWPLGGRSVYVRDPAGNSVEFVEGEIWAA